MLIFCSFFGLFKYFVWTFWLIPSCFQCRIPLWTLYALCVYGRIQSTNVAGFSIQWARKSHKRINPTIFEASQRKIFRISQMVEWRSTPNRMPTTTVVINIHAVQCPFLCVCRTSIHANIHTNSYGYAHTIAINIFRWNGVKKRPHWPSTLGSGVEYIIKRIKNNELRRLHIGRTHTQPVSKVSDNPPAPFLHHFPVVLVFFFNHRTY